MSKFVVGLPYTMELELTPLVPKDTTGTAVVNEDLFTDSVTLSYKDTGPLSVVLENERRGNQVEYNIRSDFGSTLGTIPFGTGLPLNQVLTESGRRAVHLRSRVEDHIIKIKNTSHLDSRIAAVSLTGTLIRK